MESKVNLYDLINDCISLIDFYVNLDTLEIVDEFEYKKSSPSKQQKCIEIPKFLNKYQLQIVKQYFDKNQIVKAQAEKEFELDLNDINKVHIILEDLKKWDDYVNFQENELKKMIIKWCEKYHLPYYYQEPNYSESERKEFMENFLNNKERISYYANKFNNR